MQLWPAPHMRPHEPQFDVEVWRSTSQPFDSTPSQLPDPDWQVSTQRPPEHEAGALGRAGHASVRVAIPSEVQ